MAKVRNVLIPAEVVEAKAKRRCGRSKKHPIAKGDWCLVLKDPSTGYPKNYCHDCALAILEQGVGSIAVLKGELERRESVEQAA